MAASISSPALVGELFRAGIAEAEAGQLVQAEARFRQILALDPGHAGAHHRLGLLACRSGRSEPALVHFRRSIALDPGVGACHRDLALVLAALQRPDEAEQHFRAALRLDPADASAQTGLGRLLGERGRFDAAAAAFRAAIAARPDDLATYCNLARTLFHLGQADEAIAACREALRRNPRFAAARAHLGHILTALNRLPEAEACFRDAVRIDPADAEGHRHLADVLANQQRFEPAVQSYREALLRNPAVPEVWNHLGLALRHLGRAEEAETCFVRALAMQPDLLGAGLNRCMARLRILYRDEAEIEQARAAYAKDLAAVAELPPPPSLAELNGTEPPFLLAYQGRCDRDLQQRYGRFMARLMAALYPEWTVAPSVAPPQAGGKIRVGILSANFYSHSNWKIPIKGWLTGLDRNRFELYGYHLGRRQDAATAEAAALCHRFVQGLPGIERWAETIRADRLHVLLIPGIGMDHETGCLAALRLAPVQATSWGHPDTTGLPTIDDYLSSDLMEPPGAEAHYTERLVRLPNLSIWYEQPPLAPETVTRAALGLGDDAVIYWCCQSLFKYLPRFDWVFAGIAAAVPAARFLFIEYGHGERVTGIFRARLAAAFAASGLDAGRHCVFLPPMSMSRFAAIGRIADVFLDSLGWSGCNSTLEALAGDLPVVTMAGDLMRGRHSAAILAMLGLPELIAPDPEGFVALAVALGRDPARRKALSARIAVSKHRLYRDQDAIDGLTAYLAEAAQRRTSPALYRQEK
jgi:predicted O-linked N-acetylglucosamine transferase (SPINDLY family)